jgi:hypothetical protein
MSSPSSLPRRLVQLRHARLLQHLHSAEADRPPFSFASDEALREARALGPEVAAEAVTSVLDAYHPGGDAALASRAADLVSALHLTEAIPALLSCIVRLPEDDRVAVVCTVNLELTGPERIGPTLAAFARAEGPGVRWRLGLSLCHVRKGASGVREALESMLATQPIDAAPLLAWHRDRAAVPALLAALDRIDLPSPGPDERLALAALINLGEAIRELRGKLSLEQRRKLRRAWARHEVLEGTSSTPPPEAASGPPAVRGERPGRNAPCSCGSGRKYKRCCAHLDLH